MTQNPAKLLIFDTHPIQYRSPVFRSLYQKDPNIHVYFFNPDFDGAKKYFHEIGKAQAENWGVDLLSGYPYTQLNTKALKLGELYSFFKILLLQERPRAVLFYGYYLKEHWVLRFLCHSLNIPILFIGETFGAGSKGPRRWLRALLLRYFFSGIQAFIAIGKKTETYYRSRKIAASKIFGGRYCVDTDFFVADKTVIAEKRKFLREERGIPDDAFVILFAGRLFERKRPQDVIALHRSLIENEKIHTVMVGKGELEESLRAKNTDIQRLYWVGFQSQSNIRDWYCAADLLFVPSEFETWGLVVNEAFACQLPAIVTETCGSADDLVVGGETGYIIKVGDVESARRYAMQLIQTPKLRAEMGFRAQKKVTREYRPDQFAQLILTAAAVPSVANQTS